MEKILILFLSSSAIAYPLYIGNFILSKNVKHNQASSNVPLVDSQKEATGTSSIATSSFISKLSTSTKEVTSSTSLSTSSSERFLPTSTPSSSVATNTKSKNTTTVSDDLKKPQKIKTSELLKEKPYSNTHNKYTIYYPTEWRVDSSFSTKNVQYFFSPIIDTEGTVKFATNISVTVSPNNGSFSTIENCISKEKLQIMFHNYVSISDTREEVDGVKVRIVNGTWDYGDIHLRQTQQYMIKDGLLYIVTATTLASKWDNYSKLFEASRQSITTTNN